MDVLLAYDIDTTERAGEIRLDRVAHACERYGVRVQKSVFECRLTPVRYQRLVNELLSLIDTRVDSVFLYRFDGTLTAARVSLGRRVARELGEPWII